MKRIALTGGIATGKTHVRAEFEKLGVPTIDADVLARQAVAPGTPGFAAVVARFGREVLDPSGDLDRRRLGAVVFDDANARRDLEAIVHPFVRHEMDQWFGSLAGQRHPFAIADIPLLYETGRDKDFDAVIVTACPPDMQVQRIVRRDGLTEAEARQRVAAQLPIDEKVSRADFVIDTSAAVADTNRQVLDLYTRLRMG